MNQSEEIERLSEELKQSAKECDGVEVYRDEWPAAELAAMTDGFSLGPPRGPNNDFRRLYYDAEAYTASELERLKEENDEEVSAWVAEEDDAAPDCWTEGVCWKSNENFEESDPPVAWRYPPKEPNS